MANKLIKKNQLIKILNANKINRVSPKALDLLQKILEEEIINKLMILKEEVITSGSKTLKKENIEFIFKKEDNSPEI